MQNSLSADERRDLLLSISTHRRRRRLSPMQVGALLERLTHTASLEDVAADLQMKDTSTLRRLIALRCLPLELQALVSWGRSEGHLSFSVAAEIARLEETSEQARLARAAVEHRFSKEEVRSIIQRHLRGKIPLQDSIDEILRLRPDVERLYLFIGRLHAETQELPPTKELTSCLRKALAERLGAANVVTVKVVDNRFSFILTQDGARNSSVSALLSRETLELHVTAILGGTIGGTQCM